MLNKLRTTPSVEAAEAGEYRMVSDVYLRFRYIDRHRKFHVPRVCRKRLSPRWYSRSTPLPYLPSTDHEGQVRWE